MSAIALDLELYNASATVVFADVVEYVRLVQRDEVATVRRIRELLTRSAREVVLRHGGRIVQQMGDSLLLTFADPRAAVRCACDLHDLAEQQSADLPAEDRLLLRIGVHSTEVLTDDQQAVFGHGVNLAARIMTLAGPGQTVISAATRDLLTQGLDGDIEDLGECYVKHVDAPVRAYRLQGGDAPAPVQTLARGDNLLPRVAVLPLEEYGTTPGGATTALGIGDIVTDQVIARLSRSSAMSVISRLSCVAMRGRNLRVDEVGHKLGADYVLSGRYSRSGHEVTIVAELVHAESQEVLWTDTIRGRSIDALAIDSDLVAAIAQPIAATVVRNEVLAARTNSLPNVSSHALYLFATSVLHRFSRPDFERARQMLETLKDRAPRHAAPLAWLSRWYMVKTIQGWSSDPKQDGQRALSWANRALDIDPDSSLALTMAGAVRRSVERDLGCAQRFFDRALEVNPNEPLAWLFKGTVHGLLGEADDALQASHRALSLSPLDPMRPYYESLSASAATGAGQYEQAIALAKSALRGNVTHGSTYRTLAIAQMMLGRFDEAKRTVARLMQVEPESSIERFISRVGGPSPLTSQFATALAEAGLPPR